VSGFAIQRPKTLKPGIGTAQKQTPTRQEVHNTFYRVKTQLQRHIQEEEIYIKTEN
jgi:hypothetical protein